MNISEDPREIDGLHFDNVRISVHVGQDGVTRLEAYLEPGQMAMVPYIKVWCDSHLWQRVPASLCRISYKKDIVK